MQSSERNSIFLKRNKRAFAGKMTATFQFPTAESTEASVHAQLVKHYYLAATTEVKY